MLIIICENDQLALCASGLAWLTRFPALRDQRLGSFDRIEKELPAGEEWSGYDKALGGGAYFAGRGEAAEAA